VGRRKSASQRQRQATEQKGWLPPRFAIAGIVIVSVFAAANVFYAFYKTTNLTVTIVFTILALVTPGFAAGLTYVIRQKLTG